MCVGGGGGQNERKRQSVSLPSELRHEGKYTCHMLNKCIHLHLLIRSIQLTLNITSRTTSELLWLAVQGMLIK